MGDALRSTRARQVPETRGGPTPGGLREQPGLLRLPGEPSVRSTPSLSRGCFYPRRRRNPEVVNTFRSVSF